MYRGDVSTRLLSVLGVAIDVPEFLNLKRSFRSSQTYALAENRVQDPISNT